jgi:hypothetical protein
VEGRAQDDQAPVCYTRNRVVGLSATFRVVSPPGATETVAIRGRATFGGTPLEWSGTVSVSPGDAVVTLPLTDSDAPLPDRVDCFDSDPICWEMNPAGQGWAPAGDTLNVLYVTLADPSGTPAYWTLLDVSCRAARGDTAESALVPHAFVPFIGLSLNRKRDGHRLTYWDPPTTQAYLTCEMLAASDGGGECGAWASFFIDMLRCHGVTDARFILVVRDQSTSLRFLVKDWCFHHPPPSNASALTHKLDEQCVNLPGIPGQNNPEPPPAFHTHYIVRQGGRFYDPSYGAGPFPDPLAWEAAAIDGLCDDTMAGFDKSLNPTTSLLEFRVLPTRTRL